MAPTVEPRLRKLGRRVRAVRQAAGLSQEAAAAAAGLDRTYFSRIERGLVNPSFTTLERIAATLHVHPGKLFDD